MCTKEWRGPRGDDFRTLGRFQFADFGALDRTPGAVQKGSGKRVTRVKASCLASGVRFAVIGM